MNRVLGSLGGIILAASATAALAHHGTYISYDMTKPWTTDATVVEFVYTNPHPRLIFEKANERGQTERWESELISNASMMMRQGWNRSRSLEALKPGTKVKLTLATSKTNPRSAVVRAIQNQAGQFVVMGAGQGAAGGGQGGAGPGTGDR